MNKIPLSVLFFTSSKEHFGHRDIYLATLKDLARQIPLDHFATKIAHIKVSTGHEQRGKEMKGELESRGFKVHVTHADWSRGTSHQIAYLQDQLTVAKDPEVYRNPYVLYLEDDSTLTCHGATLEEVLSRMIRIIDSSPDIISARFLRAGDLATSPMVNREADYFWSPHFNFQPFLVRSRDFHLASRLIEENLQLGSQIQIEMFWRMVLGPFSRSDQKHLVWLPHYAESMHLGVPDFPEVAKGLGLL